ncbi:MAG: EamA family transporter [Candidatus Kariarchaeaceae archaeon]
MSLAVIASLTWGLNSHILKFGLVKQNPILAISIRSIFGFPPLLFILYLWKGMDGLTIYFDSEIFQLILISSLLIVMGDGMFLIGLRKFPVNLMLPISSIYPLFTATILISTGTETVGFLIILGTVIIITGIIFVTSGGKSASFEKSALLFGVLAASGWGTSVFFVKKVLDIEGTNPLGLLGIRNLLLCIEGLVLYYMTRQYFQNGEEMTPEEKRESLKYLGISGILGDTIGASIFFIAIQRIGAAIPTPISSTNPIIASLIGYFAGIELIQRKQFFGILLCVLGTIVIVL